MTNSYAPYLTGGVLFVLSFAVIMGMLAMMKPAIVIKSNASKMSWLRVVLYALLLTTIVAIVSAIVHYIESK